MTLIAVVPIDYIMLRGVYPGKRVQSYDFAGSKLHILNYESYIKATFWHFEVNRDCQVSV